MLNSKRPLSSNINKLKTNRTTNSAVAEAEGGARARTSKTLPTMNYLLRAYPNGLHEAYIDGFNTERERIDNKKLPITNERVSAIARVRASQYGYLPSMEYLKKKYTPNQIRIYLQSFDEERASYYKDAGSSTNQVTSSESELSTEDVLQAIFSDTSDIITPTQFFSFNFSNTPNNPNETEHLSQRDKSSRQFQLRK